MMIQFSEAAQELMRIYFKDMQLLQQQLIDDLGHAGVRPAHAIQMPYQSLARYAILLHIRLSRMVLGEAPSFGDFIDYARGEFDRIVAKDVEESGYDHA